MAEIDYDQSPYNYVLNNPLRFIDPDGMSSEDPTINGGTLKEVVIRPKSGYVTAKPAYYYNWWSAPYNPQYLYRRAANGGNQKNDEKGVADHVGLASALIGPIGGGADKILKHRGKYLPRNKIYSAGREIMIRTPIANIRASSKVLNYARLGGKVLGVAGVVATGYQIYGDIDKGKYYSAGARTLVAGVATGAAFVPVVGWGIAAGIGVADDIWGDRFYDYIETQMK